MRKIKTLSLIVIGILVVGVIGAKAATLISSSQVIYNEDKTVDTALNELFDELGNGKEKLATAITNKGVTTTSDNTLEEMANNVDSISSSDPYLRYNEETKYIQALVDDGTWKNIYYTEYYPLAAKVNITPVVTTSHSGGNNYVPTSNTGISARTYTNATVTLTYTVDVSEYSYMTPTLSLRADNGSTSASHANGQRYDVKDKTSVTITLRASTTSDGYNESWASVSLTNILLER